MNETGAGVRSHGRNVLNSPVVVSDFWTPLYPKRGLYIYFSYKGKQMNVDTFH